MSPTCCKSKAGSTTAPDIAVFEGRPTTNSIPPPTVLPTKTDCCTVKPIALTCSDKLDSGLSSSLTPNRSQDNALSNSRNDEVIMTEKTSESMETTTTKKTGGCCKLISIEPNAGKDINNNDDKRMDEGANSEKQPNAVFPCIIESMNNTKPTNFTSNSKLKVKTGDCGLSKPIATSNLASINVPALSSSTCCFQQGETEDEAGSTRGDQCGKSSCSTRREQPPSHHVKSPSCRPKNLIDNSPTSSSGPCCVSEPVPADNNKLHNTSEQKACCDSDLPLSARSVKKDSGAQDELENPLPADEDEDGKYLVGIGPIERPGMIDHLS
jgi:hypothetical protein